MPVNYYPAEFRHLLSFGRRGAERVDFRDSDTLIDSRDSKKETERESQTPVNQTSLASKFARVSISARQLKQTRQHLNLALQMTPSSATSVDHFRHSPCCRKGD